MCGSPHSIGQVGESRQARCNFSEKTRPELTLVEGQGPRHRLAVTEPRAAPSIPGHDSKHEWILASGEKSGQPSTTEDSVPHRAKQEK